MSLLSLEKCVITYCDFTIVTYDNLIMYDSISCFVCYKLPKPNFCGWLTLLFIQELSPRPPNTPNHSLGRVPTRVSAGSSHLQMTEILSPLRCRTIAWSTQYNQRMPALSTAWKARATGTSGWRVWSWGCRRAPSVTRVSILVLTVQKRSSRTWSTWAWARKGSNPQRRCCVRPLLSSTEVSASLKATGDLLSVRLPFKFHQWW